ncbi:hypothetical protein GGF46_001006 [Coemansia sp. RSA 552]|nr:hypothetical protein GGF46_001006 [Coemansia sp. RSA 552]
MAAARGRVLVLALDFDRTLTAADTLSAVAATVKRKHPDKCDFQWFTDRYMTDYYAHESQWQPRIEELAPDNPSAARDLLDQYLESFRAVEEASLRRVSARRVLEGVTREELATGGRQIQFQPGATAAVSRLLNMPSCHVAIVSANWSEDFIRGTLVANGIQANAGGIQVFCNNPEFCSKTGLSSGTVRPRIVVASDKVRTMQKIKDDIASKHGEELAVVYAGDSLTDLPALLRADLGLLIGHDAAVVKWCSLLGLDIGGANTASDASACGLRWFQSWDAATKAIDHFAKRASS